jgi:uroporphyrin-III C-methyltransferase / precorrin-2 dehydrogenase / sirohydrochlorin ferrochelatase
MSELLPLFLNLTGREVALVGGGRVAGAKLQQLVAVGARVRVIAPEISTAIAARGLPNVELFQREFVASDLDDVWLVVAAATPAVNAEVAAAAEQRRVFVNAVDDPANASAFLSGVVRRDGVTIAISTNGDAPALTALVREAVDALLPSDLAAWMEIARTARLEWRRDALAMEQRKPRLLRALNARYEPSGERIPWLNPPEDSWP